MAEFKRKIGHRQEAVLEALRRHGGWHRDCGWVWTDAKETQRIMDSLVRRGLATKDETGRYRATSSGGFL